MQDKIELYLENKLNQEEKVKFESEILVNPRLAEEIERRKVVLESMSRALRYSTMFTEKEDKKLLTREQEIAIEEDIIEFQKEYVIEDPQHEARLKNVIREVFHNTEDKVREVFPIYRLAISLLIFVLISGSVFYFLYKTEMQRNNNTALIASHFFLPENDANLNEIREFLDFQRNAITDSPNDSQVNPEIKESVNNLLLLMEAISDMENEDLPGASKKIEKLYNTDKQCENPSICWYYALIIAREGNYREASRVLKKIAADKNQYSIAADSMLNLLVVN